MPAAVRTMALIGALSLSVASAACLESAFPLDPAPQSDLETAVQGTWHCISPDPGDRDMTVTVHPSRARFYDVGFQEFGQDLEQYEAHVSLVAGAPVVNLRSLAGSSKPWMFVRYTVLQPNVLRISLLDEEFVQGATDSAGALRDTIARRINDPTVFANILTCVRMADR